MQPFLQQFSCKYLFAAFPQPCLQYNFSATILAAIFSQISFVRSHFQQHLFLQPFLHQQPSSAAAIFVCSHFRSSFSAAIICSHFCSSLLANICSQLFHSHVCSIIFPQPFLQQFSRRYPLFAAIFSSISFCSHSCINNRLLQQPFLYAAISAVVFPQPLYAAIFAAVFLQIFVRSFSTAMSAV